ncbi:MAG: penicillin acylase family protein, partial [Candidatus Bipolaricaulia bacterium]
EILEVRITRHGPIINDVVSDLEQPLAFRWTATSSPNQLLRSVLRLDRARTWEEFRNALRDFDAPSQNFVYADIDGNIGYQMPGLIPIRARGRGLVPVPGWTGEYEWEGYVPFDELPSIFNPPTGYIATANNQVVPDDYPYFISAEWAAPYRAERIIALLTETETLSIEDFERIQADTYSIQAERLVPHLLTIELETELETKALERLRGWDFRYKLDSVGASIFEMTYLKLVENTFADELGEELFGDYLGRSSFHALTLERLIEDRESRWFDDVSTPEVEDREAILNRSFEQGIEMLQDQLGEDPDRWSWGRLHRSTFEHPLGVSVLSRIFNRGPVPSRGGVFTIDRAAFSYRNPFSTTSLSSYRQIVDLGALGNSQSIHTTGQSGQPYYKHYSDLIDPWQAVAYHPMYFDRETIEAEQEALLILIPG